MKRTVAIDGYNLALQRGTGVATYARSLADNITTMGWDAWTLYGAPISSKQQPMLREISFFDYLGGASPKRSVFSKRYSEGKELVRAPFGYLAVEIPQTGVVEIRRFSSRLPEKARIFNVDDMFLVARRYFRRHKKFLTVRFEEKPDIMHWTYPLPIRVDGVPNIYTIHDLVPLRLPYTTLDNKRYYHRLIKGCIESGSHICTVSEKSKEDILTLFDAAPEQVTNTYQSVDTSVFSETRAVQEAEHETLGIYGLEPRSYFLFFGAIEPKKNVGRLIEAYLSAKVNAKLVIVGPRAWKSDEEMKLLDSMLGGNNGEQASIVGEKIKIFDYAPRPFLMSLIRCAKAVVFPSLYEGFGLPLLEAMQLGVPTLCSSEGSLPEIAGRASLSVNPYEVRAIANGLQRLDTDESLRNILGQQGLIRSGMFNSEVYRNKLQRMYDSLV